MLCVWLRWIGWVYFRPIRMRRRLRHVLPGVRLRTPLWRVVRRGKMPKPMLWAFLLGPAMLPWGVCGIMVLLQGLGIPVYWSRLLAYTISVSLLGPLAALFLGPLPALLWPVVWGIGVSLVAGIGTGLSAGGLFAWCIGFYLAAAAGTEVGLAWGALILVGTVAPSFLMWSGWGILTSAATILGALAWAYRWHEYPFLVLWSLGLALVDRHGRWPHLSPPFWHDVLPWPLPGVALHMQRSYAHHPEVLPILQSHPARWVRKMASHLVRQNGLKTPQPSGILVMK